MNKFILFILFLFIFFTTPCEGKNLIKKGDLAPDFQIIDSENQKFNLYQFKEKVILIEFLSTKCFACDYVVPDINRLYEKFNKSNVKIIGILFSDEIDSSAKLREFTESRNIKYPVYYTDSKNKKTYNVYSFPNFFILGDRKEIFQMFRGITKDTYGLLNREIENILTGSK